MITWAVCWAAVKLKEPAILFLCLLTALIDVGIVGVLAKVIASS